MLVGLKRMGFPFGIETSDIVERNILELVV